MSDEAAYSPDLYRGTAEYYDRFRLPYPDALIADLARRTGASLSVLPAAALADHAAAFDDSVAAELGPCARDGYLTETVSFACELAVKGPSVAA